MNSILSWFSGVKAYVLGALSLLIGGLIVAVKILLKLKSDARKEAENAVRAREEIRKLRDKELDLNAATKKEREEARKNAESEKNRIEDGERPARWGDDRIRRMRDKD